MRDHVSIHHFGLAAQHPPPLPAFFARRGRFPPASPWPSCLWYGSPSIRAASSSPCKPNTDGVCQTQDEKQKTANKKSGLNLLPVPRIRRRLPQHPRRSARATMRTHPSPDHRRSSAGDLPAPDRPCSPRGTVRARQRYPPPRPPRRLVTQPFGQGSRVDRGQERLGVPTVRSGAKSTGAVGRAYSRGPGRRPPPAARRAARSAARARLPPAAAATDPVAQSRQATTRRLHRVAGGEMSSNCSGQKLAPRSGQ